MRLSGLLLIACSLFLASCAGKKSNSNPFANAPGRTNLIVTPAATLPGKVVSVNPNARYAVIRFPIGQLPRLEQRMNVFRGGLKVGELKISGPQRDTYSVGDIVAGECQVADEVRGD